MYTVSIRSTLAVVFVAVVISATPTQEDAEDGHATGTPSFNSVDFQQWLGNQKNRIGDAFWRLLIEIAPLLRIREKFKKQQEAATEPSPTPEPIAPSPLSTSKKSAAVEEEFEKQDKERETMEEEYTDTEDPEEPNKDEKNPPEEPQKNGKKSDEPNPPKLVDSFMVHPWKATDSQRKDENVFGEPTSELDYRPDKELKDVFLELDGGHQKPTVSSSGPTSTQKPINHSEEVHHARFKVKKAPKNKPRSLSSQRGTNSRRGLEPTKNSRSLSHSVRKHTTKSSS